MAITPTPVVIEGITIEGREAQLVRDNVENPGSNLVQRALLKLTADYRQQTLQRARVEYDKVVNSGSTEDIAGLPNYRIDDDVIDWYLGRDDYTDATVRYNSQRLVDIGNELQAKQGELKRKQEELQRQKQAGASASVQAGFQSTIESLTNLVSALQAEKESIEQLLA